MDKIGWCWEKSGLELWDTSSDPLVPFAGKCRTNAKPRPWVGYSKQSKITYYVVVLLLVLHCLLISRCLVVSCLASSSFY